MCMCVRVTVDSKARGLGSEMYKAAAAVYSDVGLRKAERSIRTDAGCFYVTRKKKGKGYVYPAKAGMRHAAIRCREGVGGS